MRTPAALIFALLLPSAATADTFLVTGSGTWDDTAPTTVESAPGAAWSFSFEVTTPLAADHTATVSAFSFSLDGAPVDDPASFVEFFTAASSGLFDVALANDDLLTLLGDQVFNALGGLKTGVFDADIEVIATNPLAVGTGSGQVTITPAAASSPVPEPSSIVTLAVGLIGLVAAQTSRGVGPAQRTRG
jgi:hypothetical protein